METSIGREPDEEAVVQRLRESAPRGRELPAKVRDLQAEAGQMEGWEEALVRWMREPRWGGVGWGARALANDWRKLRPSVLEEEEVGRQEWEAVNVV